MMLQNPRVYTLGYGSMSRWQSENPFPSRSSSRKAATVSQTICLSACLLTHQSLNFAPSIHKATKEECSALWQTSASLPACSNSAAGAVLRRRPLVSPWPRCAFRSVGACGYVGRFNGNCSFHAAWMGGDPSPPPVRKTARQPSIFNMTGLVHWILSQFPGCSMFPRIR